MEQTQAKSLKNNAGINKPIFFMGLTSMQLFILFGVFFLFIGISVYLVVVAFVVIYFIVKRIRKENRKGNPDFINAFFIGLASKKHSIDDQQLFQKLRNNEGII